jgi:hypothetical protein
MTVIDRSTIKTPEQAAMWLSTWDSEHLLFDGENTMPQRPWKNEPPRDVRSVADALLKLRALFDIHEERS